MTYKTTENYWFKDFGITRNMYARINNKKYKPYVITL